MTRFAEWIKRLFCSHVLAEVSSTQETTYEYFWSNKLKPFFVSSAKLPKVPDKWNGREYEYALIRESQFTQLRQRCVLCGYVMTTRL